LAVAEACGRPNEPAALAVATSLELLHCASLVHDDLPCFDDADMRRGKPSVHVAYGQPIAVLVGDALIVLAFEALARSLSRSGAKLAPLMLLVTGCVGAPRGIIAGQAWESEPAVDLEAYHRSKTGSLFAAACAAGALAADSDPAPWHHVGEKIGQAYQALDDALDVVGSQSELGKPVQQDARNGRPNVLNHVSIEQIGRNVSGLVDEALAAIPKTANANEVSLLLRKAAGHFSRSASKIQTT